MSEKKNDQYYELIDKYINSPGPMDENTLIQFINIPIACCDNDLFNTLLQAVRNKNNDKDGLWAVVQIGYNICYPFICTLIPIARSKRINGADDDYFLQGTKYLIYDRLQSNDPNSPTYLYYEPLKWSNSFYNFMVRDLKNFALKENGLDFSYHIEQKKEISISSIYQNIETDSDDKVIDPYEKVAGYNPYDLEVQLEEKEKILSNNLFLQLSDSKEIEDLLVDVTFKHLLLGGINNFPSEIIDSISDLKEERTYDE